MILYPRRPRPATTCPALFRILAALALSVKLVDSLAPEEELGGRDARTRGSASEEFGGAEGLTKNVGLHLRSRDFDLTYMVPKTAIDDDEGISGAREPISDDELIARAMRAKLFLTPEEWDARENYRRIDDGGDNPRGNRNGQPRMPEIEVEPECETSTVCNKLIEPYPTSFVENLKNLDSLWSAFAVPPWSHGPSNRMGDPVVDDDELCSTKKEYQELPLAVRKNLTDVWHLVINVATFRQEFNIITCERADTRCESSFGNLGDGLDLNHSICRQQYVDRTIVVMNGHGTRAVLDRFPIPGGCCYSESFEVFGVRNDTLVKVTLSSDSMESSSRSHTNLDTDWKMIGKYTLHTWQ